MWWDREIVHPLCKAGWQFLKMLNIWFRNPARRYISKRIKYLYICTKFCTWKLLAALFIIKWKQPTCLSTDEWINESYYIIKWKSISPLKRNEGLIHAITWVNCANTIGNEKKIHTNGHVLYYSIYKKCANLTDIQKQKIDC